MGRRWILVLALGLPAILIVAAALFLAWLAATGGGLRFAAALAERAVPGLQVEAFEGRLLGPLDIGRLALLTPQRQVVAEDLHLQWQPRRLLDGLLHIDRLAIGRLQVAGGKAEKQSEPPADLSLPLAVRVDAFQVGEAAFGETATDDEAAPQLSGIDGSFASDGEEHRLERLHFATARLGVAASATLGGRPPFPLTATARVSGEEMGHPFSVAADAAGSLRDLALMARTSDGELKVSGAARLDVFAVQPLRQGSLSAAGLEPAAWVEGAPHAQLDIDATLTPTAAPGELAGRVVVVNTQPGRLDEERMPLRRLDAQLLQQGEAIVVPQFTAAFTAGEAKGSARWAGGRLTVDARLAGVDAAAWHQALKPTRLAGELTAEAGPEAQQLRAQLRDPRFRVELDATRRQDGVVHIATARIAGRGGSLEAGGKLDPRGEYDLEGRLRDFDPAIFADVPAGRLNAVLDASGRLGDKPTLDLHFVLRDSRLAGRPLAGQGDVVLTPERLERADVTVRAGDNRIEARGSLGVRGDELVLLIAAPRLEQVGLGGAVRGEAKLFGPLRSPGAVWNLQSPSLALPGGTLLRDLASQGRLEPGAETIAAELTLALLDLAGDAPLVTDLAAGVEGRRNRHTLRASARVGRHHDLALAAAGGLSQAQVWQGRVENLAWRGPNPLQLVGSLPLEAGPGRVSVGAAVIAGEDWRADLDGLTWQPDRLQSAGRFANLPLAPFLPPAGPASTLRLGGEWDVDFGRTAAGRVRVFRQEGDLVLAAAGETLGLGLERLALTADFSGRQAVLALDAHGSRAGSIDGRLTVGLRLDQDGWGIARQSPWDGRAEFATPSLAWLSPLAGDDVLLGGRLQGAVAIAGTPAAPAVNGQVAGDELRLRLLDYGLDLGGGTLRLDFTPEVARLQRLEMVSLASQRPAEARIDYRRLTAQPGRLVAEGEIAIRSGTGAIRVRAEQLAVSQLPERWVMVSGGGDLSFGEGRLGVAGDIRVNAAHVELSTAGRPTLSPDVVVVGREADKRGGLRLDLDLEVDLGNSFYFSAAGLETRLAGDLHLVAAQLDQLRARGTVRTAGGSFDAYGRELTIERGILNFQGLVDNPGLNVLALRKNQQVEAGVEVTGTLKDPRVRLVSEPAVPDTEKLSWMLFGRPPDEGVGAQDADLLLSAAMALRGGSQGKGPIDSLVQGLGLEEFSVGAGSLGERSRFPSTHVAGSFAPAGGASAAEQIATIGKRIGSNAVLSYERSITTAESILKLTVELGRRLSLVGRIGATNAVGFLYSFSFGGGDRRRTGEAVGER